MLSSIMPSDVVLVVILQTLTAYNSTTVVLRFK